MFRSEERIEHFYTCRLGYKKAVTSTGRDVRYFDNIYDLWLAWDSLPINSEVALNPNALSYERDQFIGFSRYPPPPGALKTRSITILALINAAALGCIALMVLIGVNIVVVNIKKTYPADYHQLGDNLWGVSTRDGAWYTVDGRTGEVVKQAEPTPPLSGIIGWIILLIVVVVVGWMIIKLVVPALHKVTAAEKAKEKVKVAKAKAKAAAVAAKAKAAAVAAKAKEKTKGGKP